MSELLVSVRVDFKWQIIERVNLGVNYSSVIQNCLIFLSEKLKQEFLANKKFACATSVSQIKIQSQNLNLYFES